MEHMIRPNDFEEYWDVVDQELRQHQPAEEVNLMHMRSSEISNVYAVRLTSIGPYRIFGYFSVPTGQGPFPGLVLTPKYGSVNHLPHYDDRQRYAVLTIMHRGQRLADEPFAASYPGLLTLGIDNPMSYIYRGIVADCLRGAEFLMSRPEVDTSRVAIAGDDLALITAARRPDFTAVHISGPKFYRLMEARNHTETYPIEEVNDYLRTYTECRDAVSQTLSYMDPLFHAERVRAKTLISAGSGDRNGALWLRPLIGELEGHAEVYTLTHEGGTDHDWTDAWIAQQLEVEPKPRLWNVD